MTYYFAAILPLSLAVAISAGGVVIPRWLRLKDATSVA
jgi:hypothetical protein